VWYYETKDHKRNLEQIKTAYASDIDLREIARNMSPPAGTVFARAKPKGGLDSFSQQRGWQNATMPFLVRK